jgi:hypothetical protein
VDFKGDYEKKYMNDTPQDEFAVEIACEAL